MEPITTQRELRTAILQLENKQSEDGKALKKQIYLAYNSMKPANIILDTLKDLGESSIIKDNFLNTTVGFGTGYLSKMIFQGVVKSPLKKLIGSVLMYGVTNLVTNNTEAIKLMASKIFKLFGSHSEEDEEEEEVQEPENY